MAKDFGCYKNVCRRDASVIGLREESIRAWKRTNWVFCCREEILRQRKERLSGGRWRCGQKAALALADFIGRSPVRCKEHGVDRYGRVIAACYVRDEDVERWMVTNGWALAYRRYSDDYVDEEAIAQDAHAGIWRGQFVPPWEWRRGERLNTDD